MARKTTKGKELTYEKALDQLNDLKEVAKEALTEMNAYSKKKKYKKGDPKQQKDPKWKALNKKHKTAASARDEMAKTVKSLKPPKKREYKYDYPEDIIGDAEAMKKFRTQQRAKDKKASKGSTSKAKGKAKTTKKAAPKKTGKTAKTTKKVVKAAPPAGKKKVVKAKKKKVD